MCTGTELIRLETELHLSAENPICSSSYTTIGGSRIPGRPIFFLRGRWRLEGGGGVAGKGEGLNTV